LEGATCPPKQDREGAGKTASTSRNDALVALVTSWAKYRQDIGRIELQYSQHTATSLECRSESLGRGVSGRWRGKLDQEHLLAHVQIDFLDQADAGGVKFMLLHVGFKRGEVEGLDDILEGAEGDRHALADA